MPSVHHIGTTSVRQPLRGGPAVVPETCRLDCLFVGPHAGRVRTPQRERSRATQQRLLDATVACLIEHGWSGTTTTLVAEKAGVSRGAQLHHYPTKAALVLAAVEHLAARRADETRPGVREAVQATLDLLRGLGVANLLSDDTARRRAILAAWTGQLATVLRPA